MANEAIKLKVSEETYSKALGQLGNQLVKLEEYRISLQGEIDKLNNGVNFAGSYTKSAREKAERSLKTVEETIPTVQAYKDTIQKQLDAMKGKASSFESEISNIDIPRLFE